MSNPKDYGLKDNPFPLFATEIGEAAHLWAGMPEIKRKMEDIIHSVLPDDIGCSEFIVLHGEYGGGKTHALRYFEREIKDHEYGHTFFVSKTRMLEKLSFTDLFNSIMKESGDGFFLVLAEKIKRAINSELHAINSERGSDNLAEQEEIINKIAVGNRSMVIDLLGKKHPKATDDYDAASKLAALLNVMTTPIGAQQAPYKAVYLFMDEMEEILDAKPTQLISFFNACRELINRVPGRFALIWAFTTEAAANLEVQIPLAIQERESRPMVELNSLSNEEAKTFIRDFLSEARIDKQPPHQFFPFSEKSIDVLLERHQLFPRKIILGMRRIFERATRNGRVQPGQEIPQEVAEEILNEMGL